jgi:hypothetical protein
MAASTATTSAGTILCIICQTLTTDKPKLGILLCLGCQESFCYGHIGQHRQQLADQLNTYVVDERNHLCDIISKLEDNYDQHTEQLRKNIDDWEQSSHEAISQIAERTREKLREMSLNECRNLRERYDRLSAELNSKRESETYFVNDIEVLKRKFHELKDDIENFGLNVDIEQQLQSIEFINIKKKPSSSDSFIDHLLLSKKPIKSLNTQNNGAMYGISDNLLAIEMDGAKYVNLYDSSDGSVNKMDRFGACASLVCYSTYLQSFIYFIRHRGSEGYLYRWNVMSDGEHTKLELNDRDRCEISALTSYKTNLVLVWRDDSIEKWNLNNLNNLKLEKEWIKPTSCESNETILNVGMNSQHYALLIRQSDGHYFHLRNTAMSKIGIVKTDNYGMNQISLPNESGWLVFYRNSNDKPPYVIDNQLNVYVQKYVFEAKVRDIDVQGTTVIIRYAEDIKDAKKSSRGLIEYYTWT